MSRSRNDIFLQVPVKIYPNTIESESKIDKNDQVIIPQPIERPQKPHRNEIRIRAEALIERSNKPIGLLDADDKSSLLLTTRSRSKSSSSVQHFGSLDQFQKVNFKMEMLDLVYLPIKKNLLGEGRHANVYSGYVRSNKTINNQLIQGPEIQCAVKVLNNVEESSSTGLMEAYCLNLLKHHNILRIYGFMEFHDEMGKGTQFTSINLDEMNSITPDVFMNQCQIFQSDLLRIPDETHFMDFSSDKHRLLILEYAKCGTLWDICQKTPRLITRRQIVRFMKELSSSLILMQEKHIIHHDIKPGNILLGEFNVTKLSDFGNALICTPGICKTINDQLHLPISASRGRGTTVYQAPELFNKNTLFYNNSVDMYSFGCMLWVVAILGKEPFGKIQSIAMLHQIIQRGFLASELNWPSELMHSDLQDCEVKAAFPDKLNVKDAKGIYNPYNGRVLRFLNGEVVDIWIYELLRDCTSLSIQQRPSPKEFLYRIKLNDGGLDATDFFL